MDGLHSANDELVVAMKRGAAEGAVVRREEAGWAFRFDQSGGLWRFAARPEPYGALRGERDEVWLKNLVAALGAPREPLVAPSGVHPSEALHWSWWVEEAEGEDLRPKPRAPLPGGPVLPLPKPWTSRPWSALLGRGRGTQFEHPTGLRIVSADGPRGFGGSRVREVEAWNDRSLRGELDATERLLVRAMFFHGMGMFEERPGQFSASLGDPLDEWPRA